MVKKNYDQLVNEYIPEIAAAMVEGTASAEQIPDVAGYAFGILLEQVIDVYASSESAEGTDSDELAGFIFSALSNLMITEDAIESRIKRKRGE